MNLLRKLIDAELSTVKIIAGDGHPSLAVRSNEEAASVALQTIMDELVMIDDHVTVGDFREMIYR